MRIVSTFTPGGANDLLARFAAAALSPALGVPVVVENRPGSGGNLGVELVARAAPDGQTLLMAAGSAAVNQTLFRNLPFDIQRDFAPITVVGLVPNVLSVPAASSLRDVPGIVAHARAKPDGITYGSAGIGTIPHLAMALFLHAVGARGVHVPFRGSAPAITELVAGRLDAVFENLPPQAQQLRAGTLRGLCISSATRYPDFPDLPTAAEAAGLPGFEVTAWQSLLAPAGTPAPVVDRVAAVVAAALATAEGKTRLAALGAVPSGMPPAQFRAFLAAEVAKWGEAVRVSGAAVE